jgi:hypothetical protein
VCATIAGAGLRFELGPWTIRSVKLINPGMAYVVLVVLAAYLRARERSERSECPSARERSERPSGTDLQPPRPEAVPTAGPASPGWASPGWASPGWASPGWPAAWRGLALTWLLAAVPLACVAWGRCLEGGFIREDFQRLQVVRDGAPWNGAAWSNPGLHAFYGRQVSLILDSIALRIWGLSVVPWHVTNLGLHVLVAGGVGAVCLLLCRDAATASLACVLFALHPIAVEPVAWIAARDDSVAALLALACTALVVLAARRRSRALASASALVFAAALFAKESVLSLPGALAVAAWMAEPARRGFRVPLRAFLTVAPHAAVLAAYVLVRGRRLMAMEWDPVEAVLDWPKVLLLPLSPIAPLAFPVNMASLADVNPAARLVIGLALCAGLGLCAARWRRLCDPTAVGLFAWTVLLSVPVYRMIHLSAVLQNNRYLYLPATGFSCLFAHLLRGATADPALPRRFAASAPLLICGIYFALARVNVEPWVAMGAVAARVNRDLAVVAARLEEGRTVRVSGLPEQYRGAYLLSLSSVVGPMLVLHGLAPGSASRLVELYHTGSGPAPPPRRAGDLELRWTAGAGFIEEPQPARRADGGPAHRSHRSIARGPHLW